MQVSVSPPRAKGAGRVPLWRGEMVGYTSRPVDGVERLAGAKRGALEAASLVWFATVQYLRTYNCDWQS